MNKVEENKHIQKIYLWHSFNIFAIYLGVIFIHDHFIPWTAVCTLVCSVILLILISLSEQTPMECCSLNAYWDGRAKCSDGSKVTLNCTFYVADPQKDEYDNFTINQNSSELMFSNSYSVSKENYCIISNGTKQTALICFSTEDFQSNWRFYMLGTLFVMSSFFLIFTLIIYAYLPELRDIQDKSMICVMISLISGFLTLSVADFSTYGNVIDNFCVSIAFIVYYSFLAAFFWLNMVSFNIWRSVWFRNFAIKDDSLFAIFCLIGWGFPMCFLIAALTTHHVEGVHLKPGFSEFMCWFPGGKELWVYFLGPSTVLLLLNIFYLSMTSWKLWNNLNEYNGCKLRVLRVQFLLYIKLFFVMGMTWIFEILSSIKGWGSDIFWLPVDILNASQGIIMFIILVVTRTKVKILLAKRKPCGILFPKSWALQTDEESDNTCPEEIELSRGL